MVARTVIILLASATAVVAIAVGVMEGTSGWVPPPAAVLFMPTGFQGSLPVPEAQFLPLLQKAHEMAQSRFERAGALLLWKSAVTYIALAITLVVSGIAAFYGRRADALSESAPSASVSWRVLAVLLAISGALTELSRQIETQANSHISSATRLSESITDATATLYDTDTSIARAKIALRRVEDALVRP
jgi:hypothetical protein